MKILTSPFQKEVPGELIETPESLKQTHRIQWTTPHCRKYDFGVILHQEFIHKYYTINIYYCQVQQKVILYPHFDKPAIALLVFGKGSVIAYKDGAPALELNGGMFSLVYIPGGTHEVQLNADVIEVCLILFEKAYLAELTEGWPMQEELMELINTSSKTGMPYPSVLLNYESKAEIHRMHSSAKKDYLLVLELKSCITKLLGAYLTGIADKMQFISLPDIPYKDVLIDMWESIKADPNIHHHTVQKLAVKYNMHIKTLSRKFAAIFGTGIAAFVREQCMQKAYLLVTTTPMPLDDIAFEVGYSELTNFNRAFRSRFNTSAQSLRTNR